MLVTDMDGTLADTRDAVQAAYRAAGVARFPEGWWGRPAREWLGPDWAETRALKNLLYPAYRHLIRELPAAHAARCALRGGYPVAVLTAASEDAALLVLETIGLWGWPSRPAIHSEQSLDMRRWNLEYYGRTVTEGIYLDDSPSNVAMAREVLPTWLVAQV